MAFWAWCLQAAARLVWSAEPGAVVHFAGQRAAPYSMIARRMRCTPSRTTWSGNLNLLFAIAETNPDIHLVKLGTMGERQVRLRRGVQHRAEQVRHPGGHRPLTVYGEGGQTCGIIGIRDTVRCIQLACENPVNRGEFRAFNQMPQSMSVAQIAETVQAAFPGTSPSRAWTTLSADPNRTRVIRPYGECHLGPE